MELQEGALGTTPALGPYKSALAGVALRDGSLHLARNVPRRAGGLVIRSGTDSRSRSRTRGCAQLRLLDLLQQHGERAIEDRFRVAVGDLAAEQVAPAKLKRTDRTDENATESGTSPKVLLKADKETGRILLDSETTLAGVPADAWEYKLGNRSALEWILDQYKEKRPKDPTIRAKFNTYRFADYKEKVIDLLARVTTVSIATVRIVEAMRQAPR